MVNVSESLVRQAKAIIDNAPEEVAAIEQGKKTVHKVTRELKKNQAEAELEEAQEQVTEEKKADIRKVCDIRHCSMAELFASGIKPDAVITDPPYEEKYLHVYRELAELSKDIPLVAVMCGQTYLPEVLASMSRHLKYRWTMAYLTPGGQAVQIWPRKVNTFWKPILLFGEAEEWHGDVANSKTNDNDKRFHDWGQSESGMAEVIEKLTKPGQLPGHFNEPTQFSVLFTSE